MSNETTHFVGVAGSSRAFVIAQIALKQPRLVVIVKDRAELEALESDLGFFISNRTIAEFPAWDTLPFEPVSPQLEISAQRNRVRALARDTSVPWIILVSSEALLQRALPWEYLESRGFTLNADAQLGTISEIATLCRLASYAEVSVVESIGEMAVRGEVIDIFPALTLAPIRISVDANGALILRYFDPDSQRTTGDTTSCLVTPAKETLPWHILDNSELLAAASQRIIEQGKICEVAPREAQAIVDGWRKGLEVTPGSELFHACALPQFDSLLEELTTAAPLVLCDPLGIEQHVASVDELINERYTRLRSEHQFVPNKDFVFISGEAVIRTVLERANTSLDPVELLDESGTRKAIRVNVSSHIELSTRMKSKVGTGKAFAPLVGMISKLRREGFDVGFVVGSRGRAERLQQTLLDSNLDAQIADLPAAEWLTGRRAPLTIVQGHLSHGLLLHDEKLAIISELEIFGERSYRKRKSKHVSIKKLMSALGQLGEGDYVVHNDYGIGVYRGLKHLEVQGTEGDFLQIDYADSRLYLPVQNINKIQKFSGADGQKPALDKLGGTRWLAARQKVREQVITLAGDLIQLYAQREVAKGWRFEPFGAEDERFAESFAYNETPDQEKAIGETLADMATDRPMDRLVCGDVGFGKTEVAIRAAFKCVQHGRQAAVLVPTTILVDQHLESFLQRFKGYDTRIGAISRFYSPKENKEQLAKLAAGDLDIIIGTHRLLSRDVTFKDLGLLIIDEEHRFGVAQKEKLKSLKKSVDVLTLTATPIPRTLHQSLLDIRDISVIQTPPHDRKNIRTYVASTSDSLIRDAILREIQRGGQVFLLHNRIDSIVGTTARLAELIPEARFVFGHGQMHEDQLELIMQQFITHEADVLVSTTIIESGLDIPNANTIIIERADMLGLAQLYQLRGRVGRSTRQAYAYLLIPSARNLTEEAQRRLSVLQGLDDLGLGFNLALNDLEIRGAGNLLGKEQSGAVLAVGFEQYTRILKEAIAHLKGEELAASETIDPEVKIGITAFIPDAYIPDLAEKLILYQRLGAIVESQEADDLSTEIEDRFGVLPEEVVNLVELMRLRGLLRRHGVVRGEYVSGKFTLNFVHNAKVDGEKVIKLIRRFPDRFKFTSNFTLVITYEHTEIESPKDLYPLAAETLAAIEQTAPSVPIPSDSKIRIRPPVAPQRS